MRKLVRGLARRWVGGAAMLVWLAAIPVFAECLGDCNGDGEVTVDEIVSMVNVALGTRDLSVCPAGDRDDDSTITVDEIIGAVNTLLTSCPTTGGELGDRRFTFSARSDFAAVLNQGFRLPLGAFRGQHNGELGPAYLVLRGGVPDENGVAPLDVVEGSDYFVVQAQVAQILVCIRPVLPARNAGLVQCNGGLDFSILLEVDHHVGQIGQSGFTLTDCLSTCSGDVCGQIEGPTQICAAGAIGELCRSDSDCDSVAGAGDGRCGLGRYCVAGQLGANCTSDTDCNTESGTGQCSPTVTCTQGKNGSPCRNDSECDTSPGAGDGACGPRASHPGVCNGPLTAGSIGEDSGPGAAVLAPVLGMVGLPAELAFERALPCGDEPNAAGFSQTFAFTTGTTRAVVRNVSDEYGLCTDNSACQQDSDCEDAQGPDPGVCGHRLIHEVRGENMSCEDWRNPEGPGCFVLAAPLLHAFQGADLVTEFKFCGR